jgi:hypothetical protein
VTSQNAKSSADGFGGAAGVFTFDLSSLVMEITRAPGTWGALKEEHLGASSPDANAKGSVKASETREKSFAIFLLELSREMK